VKLIYSLLMFPVVIVFALCYYTISFPIMFLVGTYIVICGILEKVDWNTYDRDIIQYCDNSFLCFIWSFWTNRREPMPTGGKKNLWKNKPEIYRYIRWHIRNPLSDLGMYYVGFAGKKYKKLEVLNTEHVEINLKKLNKCPLYFPRYSIDLAGGFNFSIGWKKRGCFGLHLKK